MTTLLKDDRKILGLTLASGKKLRRFNGEIKQIVVYEELGQGAYVPWFAIYGFGGFIIARVNAAHVEEVRYE